MGGLKSATVPPRIRSGLGRTCGGPVADPPGGQFPRTQVDPLRTPPESAADQKVHRESATDPPQVRGGAPDFLIMKKTIKVRQSAKKVRISPPRTFFRFWRTIFSAADYFVRPGSAADSLRIFGPLKKSAQKILPIMVRLKSPLKKSILKICRRTSSGLRQGGQTSTDEVRLV